MEDPGDDELWKYQVEEGELELHWPSWSFALKTGVVNLVTVLGNSNALVRQELKCTVVGDDLTSLIKLEQGWKKFGSAGPRIFVQGTNDFVEKMLKTLSGKVTKSINAMTPNECGKNIRLPGLSDRQELSHKSQGGVTTAGRWTLHSKNKLDIPSNGVKRLLGHIVTPVESGRNVSDRDKALTKLDRIPSGSPDILVHVPSVFTKGNLVARKLTDRELMDAYDIEVPDQKLLMGFKAANHAKSSNAFVKEPPLKVLMAATRASLIVATLLTHLGIDEGESDGSDSENDVSSDDKKSGDADNTDSAKSQTGPDDVAAKNDDAVVDVEKWDRWTVDNFEGDSFGNSALVCKLGTYSPDHVRLFDSFRALLIRRCRRKAFRGLCKHLENKHGDGGHVPFEMPFHKLSRRMKKRRKGEPPVNSSLLPRVAGLERIFGKGLNNVKRTIMVPSWTMKNKSTKMSRKRRFGRSAESINLELIKDVKVGSDAIRRLAGSTWWNWDCGSTLLFWHWPKRYQKSIRDGTPLFVHKGLLRSHFSRQRWPNDPLHK